MLSDLQKVMGFFFGKILCRGHAVVFFKNPVKIRNALETTGLADDRERIAALFHLVYGMTEAKLINIFFYGEGFCPPDSFRTHRRIRRYPGRSEALYSLR